MEKEIVYFELNNWSAGKDFPDCEPFLSWMGNDLNIRFRDEQWVRENRLCVVAGNVDMSQNFCITATKEWVEQKCPQLLAKYQQFLREPDEDGYVYGKFDHQFLSYCEEDIGITWVEEDD